MARPHASSRWFALTTALAWAAACGGGAATGKGPEHADAPADEQTASSDEGTDSGSEDEEITSAAPAPSCSDGTCSPCGDGLCPSGWYCDETAKGGAACSWLPECTKKPGCACLERALPGCSCEEQGGGEHVNCK
jgi:hypothetical protein